MKKAPQKKRVRVIYAGGLEAVGIHQKEYVQAALDDYFGLQLVAETEVSVIDHKPGTDITWDVIANVGEDIAKHYTEYDGFVVLHSMDNVLYSSALLRFMFDQLTKPVVFTGASLLRDNMTIPGSVNMKDQTVYAEMSIRTNLMSALQVCTTGYAEVMLAYGPMVLRAVRSVQDSIADSPVIVPFGEPELVHVQFGAGLKAQKGLDHSTMRFNSSYSDRILILNTHPGMRIPDNAEKEYDAIIIQGNSEQLIPRHLKLPSNIPVIVHGQGRLVEHLHNVIAIDYCTFPAAMAKTLVGLKRTQSTTEFIDWFAKQQHNEFVL